MGRIPTLCAGGALICSLAGCGRPDADVRNLTETPVSVVVQFRDGEPPARTTLGVGELAQLHASPDKIASIDYRGTGVNCRLRKDQIPGETFGAAQLGPIVGLPDCRSRR